MNLFKFLGALSAILLLCGIGFGVLPEEAGFNKNAFFEQIQENSFLEADLTLKKHRRAIDRGYLKRERKDLKRSDLALHQAPISSGSPNQMPNAFSLYRNERFNEAKKEAAQALQTDPSNQRAKKLLGFIAYKEGNYKLAYYYLNAIEPKTLKTTKILAITFLLNGKEKEGEKWVEKLGEKGALTEDFYFELVFGELILNHPLQAEKWLQKAGQGKPLSRVARYFISFELDSWQEAISYYDKIPAQYKLLDGLHSVLIESYSSLGNEAKAEKLLTKLLHSPAQPDIGKYPDYFQTFIRKKLDPLNRYYIAAVFYKSVKGDLKKALEYLNQIKNPTYSTEIEKGEIYLQGGDLNTAKTIFQRVLKDVEGKEAEKKIQLKLFPLLANICLKTGFFPESVKYYEKFYALKPEDKVFRIPYAKALMSVKRFDLALEQFLLYKKRAKLLQDDNVDYIESLIKTASFDKADAEAKKWIFSENVSLIYQIKIAELMVITKNKAFIEHVLSEVSKKTVKSLQENLQLIQLWMALGDYKDAISLAGSIMRVMETFPQGLMVLAHLYMNLSEYDQAIDFAEKAWEMSPRDRATALFIRKYKKSSVDLLHSIKSLKEGLEQNPKSLTLQTDLASQLIELAISLASNGEVLDVSQSKDLQKAKDVLLRITEENKEFPKPFFLLGKAYYLLNQEKKARSCYEAALKLDVSYVDAYQYISLIDEEEKAFNKAISSLRTAAKFAPSNVSVWQQLAELYDKEKKHKEAVDSLKHAIQYAPNDPASYTRIASVYLEMNEPLLAVDNLNIALHLSPKNITAIDLMLIALYDEKYIKEVGKRVDIVRLQYKYFDKLQALDPKEAKAMRKRLGVPEE